MKILPPVWTVIAMVLSVVLSKFAPIVIFGGPGWLLLGFFCMMSSVVLLIYSAIFFYRAKTPIHPHQQPTALVKDGPYRMSRNPMYLAMVLIVFFFNFIVGGLSGFFAVPFLFIILRNKFAIPEEKVLIATFGEAAKAWIAQKPRFLF